MQFAGPAIVCASRPHGETAAIVRLLTEAQGLLAGYVAGGRGRQLRPVLVPGNVVEADLRARIEGQLPFARLELVTSRGPWLGEPLPAAAIGWATALTAAALPERHAYPALFPALGALLDAVCHAPSARGWLPGLIAYEALLLRELGYGDTRLPQAAELPELLAAFDALGQRLDRYPLAERRNDVMGARAMLRERLAKLG
ncbi:MAG: recombination protein O N-terminal domain-containing protein [Sphingomonadaceae bacterium]